MDYQFFQRDGSTGDIFISGSYQDSPTSIEASFNNAPFSIIDLDPSNDLFSGTLINQPIGQGDLVIRFTNDTGVAHTISNISI